MTVFKKHAVVAAVVLAFASMGHGQVNSDGDWQLWTHDSATVKLSENVTGLVDVMYRFGDDMSDLWYQHYDVGVIYKVSDWLSIKSSYRVKMVNLDSFAGDTWLNINNPNLNFMFTKKIGKTILKNNCRFSYWDYAEDFNRTDLLYCRNIFTIIGPKAFTKAKIKPFIKEDFFYNTDINEVDRNRLSTGLLVCNSKMVTP